jgi:hypothetical protein
VVTEDIHPIFLIQFERLEPCVREFARYDPNSCAFRYPIDTSLNPYRSMPSTVDLINLRSVMDRMAQGFKSARELLQAQVEDLEIEGDLDTRSFSAYWWAAHLKMPIGRDRNRMWSVSSSPSTTSLGALPGDS